MRTTAHRPAIDLGAPWVATTTISHRHRDCRSQIFTTTHHLRLPKRKMHRPCSSMQTASSRPRNKLLRRDHPRRRLLSFFTPMAIRSIARGNLLSPRHHPPQLADRLLRLARHHQTLAKLHQMLVGPHQQWAGCSQRTSFFMSTPLPRCDPHLF